MRLQELVAGNHCIEWEGGEATSVDLSNRPEIGDDAVGTLLGHPTIQKLYMGGTGLTDQGVAALRELPQLEWLELSDTAVTDAGIAALGGTTTLHYLFLCGCRVTDGSLPALLSMTGLQEIGLDETLLSKEGRETLSGALPEMEIS